MSGKVVCMASAKGGSGKTVLTAAFGALLASLGKTVLLVDTDGATNGLSLFYLKEVMAKSEYVIAEGRTPLGIYECVDTTRLADVVELPNNVDLIPATFKFQNTEMTDLQSFKECLRDRLVRLRELFDYIFLDAQAGSDLCAQAAMSRDVSDEVVIVSEYDPVSAAGVERLKGLLREDLTYERTWVLLNKLLPDFVQSFSDFLQIAKYLNPIPWDADVVKAYARRRLALDLANGNEHTLAIVRTIKTLLGESISSEFEAWTEKHAATIRQPLEDQYKDLERELETLIEDRYLVERQIEKQRFMRLAVIFGGTLATVIFLLLFGHFSGLFKDESALTILPSVILVTAALFLVAWGLSSMVRKPSGLASGDARIYRRIAVLEESLRKLGSGKEC